MLKRLCTMLFPIFCVFTSSILTLNSEKNKGKKRRLDGGARVLPCNQYKSWFHLLTNITWTNCSRCFLSCVADCVVNKAGTGRQQRAHYSVCRMLLHCICLRVNMFGVFLYIFADTIWSTDPIYYDVKTVLYVGWNLSIDLAPRKIVHWLVIKLYALWGKAFRFTVRVSSEESNSL